MSMLFNNRYLLYSSTEIFTCVELTDSLYYTPKITLQPIAHYTSNCNLAMIISIT